VNDSIVTLERILHTDRKDSTVFCHVGEDSSIMRGMNLLCYHLGKESTVTTVNVVPSSQDGTDSTVTWGRISTIM
jgi:hypothetical protein